MAKRYNNYAEKKEAQRAGTYEGNSPFFKNTPEFQYLKPLSSYPHLKGMRADKRNNYDTPPQMPTEFDY